ncbi:hypothetical protein [Paracoccus actinidiae]|uniref:hypothetical protein n=1 Tax=Paracoccus actinidiae TaxID=3064531 RepID=UPI0027D2357C|nr:hypothetical protein [Paracoccus sp. M09]
MIRAGTATIIAMCAMPAFAESLAYNGMCEASAGVLLDDNRFAAISDETNDMTPENNMLHTYEIGTDKPKLFSISVEASDIEAATRVGNTIYWLTSHSLNKSNQDRPKRKNLFAGPVGNLSVSEAGWPFTSLREMIAPAIEQAVGIEAADLKARLNIEGLAARPNGHLLIGLREPLAPAAVPTERRALVINIGDASAIVGDQLREVQGSAVYRLPLGGRGIRSIERVGERFLIIAGKVHGADDGHRVDFGQYEADLTTALFWWDGISEDAVQIDFQVDLSGLGTASPEGLVVLSDNDVLILGDNGDICSDKDDETEDRHFPTVTISF